MKRLGSPAHPRGALHLPAGQVEAVNGHLWVEGSCSAELNGGLHLWLWVRGVGSVPVVLHDRASGGPADSLDHPQSSFHASFVVARDATDLFLELWAVLEDGERVFLGDWQGALIHRQSDAQTVLERGGGDEIRANVDTPRDGQRVPPSAEVPVQGWAWSSQDRVTHAWLEIGGERVRLRRGVARPDVGAAFPHVAEADRSGFAGEFEAPGHGSHFDLELWVELDDGSRHRLLSRRLELERSDHAPRLGHALFALARRVPLAHLAERATRRARSAMLRVERVAGRVVRRPGVPPQSAPLAERAHAYERWRETNRLTPSLRQSLRSAAGTRADGPRISLMIHAHRASVARLTELVRSLRSQLHEDWELCILDDGTSGPYLRWAVEREARGDARIELRPAVVADPAAAFNALLARATGEFVGVLEPDALLPMDALLQVADHLRAEPGLSILYTDDELLDQHGEPCQGVLKPPWNPALALCDPYLGRLCVMRRTAIEQVGGADGRAGTAFEHDLLLRIVERAPTPAVGHVAKVCCQRRGPCAEARPDDLRQVVAAALGRRGYRAQTAVVNGRVHLRWSPEVLRASPVTILIPTRDRVDLLRRCVESLRETVPTDAVELVVIDDHSEAAETLAYFRELESGTTLRCRVVRPEGPRARFDFAKLVNFGAGHARHPNLLLLNNDTEARAAGWLEDMAGWLSTSDVGAVGARLAHESGIIEHAGVAIGPHSGLADHQFRGTAGDDPGYLGLAKATRDVSAVTGACLLTEARLFHELGGLDEEHFSVDYNDVDYCLRLRAAGHRVVISATAELVHVGGASRGTWYDASEHWNFITRYCLHGDAHLNPNWNVDSPSLEVAAHHFIHGDRAPFAIGVLAVHSERSGDPTSAFADYVDALTRLGADIQVTEFARELPPFDDVVELRRRVRAFALELRHTHVDVVVARGAGSHWGVELAAALGRPSLWLLDERFDSRQLAAGGGPLANRELFFGALANATRVGFASESVSALAVDANRRDHHRIAPLGVSVVRLDAFRRTHSRASLRARHRLREADTVVLVDDDPMGALSGRVARALKDVESSTNAVGSIAAFAARGEIASPIGRAQDRVSRSDVLAMGDLLVLGPATQELFPRVLLEAMAQGLAVLAPGVPGVGELVGHEREGLLIDVESERVLAATLRRCHADRGLVQQLGANAAVKVRRVMDASRLAHRHAALIRETLLAE